jgi:HTH-type transcriptional regulator/antitoxin HipB
MDIGKIVRTHRKWAGLTQIELARIAGVGKTVIHDIEKGKETIRFQTLGKVCRVLNVTLTWESPFREKFDQLELAANKNESSQRKQS